MDQLPNTGVGGGRKREREKEGERTGKKGEGRGEGLVSSNKYIWGRVGGMAHVPWKKFQVVGSSCCGYRISKLRD